MHNYAVVITGASGSVYGLKLVEQLLSAGRAVTLIVTDPGREVMAFETGYSLPEHPGLAVEGILRFLEVAPGAPLKIVGADDPLDLAASGPALIDGMVACPATMGWCGAVAAGLTSDLTEKVAELMLKERRPFVIVPLEAPLSLVHLRNLTALSEAGAIIVPASPVFRNRPTTIDDLVDSVVGTVLDQLDVEHHLYR